MSIKVVSKYCLVAVDLARRSTSTPGTARVRPYSVCTHTRGLTPYPVNGTTVPSTRSTAVLKFSTDARSYSCIGVHYLVLEVPSSKVGKPTKKK